MNSKFSIALSLIFILAICTRLFFLNYHPLSGDEIFTLDLIKSNELFNLLTYIVEKDTQQPLFYLISYTLFKNYLPLDVWLVRLPSMFFSLVGIWVHYINAKKLMSKTLALQSTTLLTLSFILLFHSTEVRMYSLLFLLLNIQTHYFLKISIERQYKFTNVLNWLVFGTLSGLTHYFGLLYFFTEFFNLLVVNFKRIGLKKLLTVFFFLMGLLALLSPEILRHINTYHPYRHIVGLSDFLGVVAYLFSGKFFILFLLFSVIAIKKPYYQIKEFIHNYSYLFFSIIFPIVFVFFKSIVSAPVFEARYFIGSVSPFYLLVTLYMNQMKWRLESLKQALFILLVAGSLLNVIWKEQYFKYPYRVDSQGIAKEIISEYEKQRPLNIITCNTCPSYYIESQDIKLNCFYGDVNYQQKDKSFNTKQPTLYIESSLSAIDCSNIKSTLKLDHLKLYRKESWGSFYKNY